MASIEESSKKRVFIYVPFSPEMTDTGKKDDFDNPNYSAKHWVEVRSKSIKSKQKEYQHIMGHEAFEKIEFRKGDRIYVHAHGGDWGEIFAKGGKSSGKEITGIDKHTPESLWHSMIKNKSFARFGTSDNPLDLRIAACHSADGGSFNAKLSSMPIMRSLHGTIKGKEGEFSANTGRILKSGLGMPSKKGLVKTWSR